MISQVFSYTSTFVDWSQICSKIFCRIYFWNQSTFLNFILGECSESNFLSSLMKIDVFGFLKYAFAFRVIDDTWEILHMH